MADPAFTLSIIVGVLLCGLLMLWALHSSSGWHHASKSGARLPEGSFSWPIIGDTLPLNRDPLNWGISQEKRYGKIFKASLFFRKTIVGTTPEFAKFVLQNSSLFKVSYPKHFQRLAPRSGFIHEGPRHLLARRLFAKVTLAESLQAMFKTLDGIVFEKLASWEQKGTVNGSEAAEQIVEDTASYFALGVKNIRSTPQGIQALENLRLVIDIIGRLPVNLPGTAFHKGMKAREDLRSYIKDLLVTKRSEQETETTLVRALVEAQRDVHAKGAAAGVDFDDDGLLDDAVVALIGAFKTTSTTMTWTLKYLFDHPEILRRVRAEQQDILEGKDLSVPGPRLTWADTKKMVYTTKFFLELQRILSISFMVPREATQDIVYEGVLIPKGWQVLPLLNLLHANDANYPDPLCFNPDRFDAPPKPFTYMPFGIGIHRCPGEELAKLVPLIFIHYLTTTYTYAPAGPDLGDSHRAFPIINGGYPIKVHRRV